MNRLGSSTSPYLRQHAANPVDWWPWSDAALAEARERDVPVLISVGYAACHWCHVMAHESFEDPVIGAKINANFVAIKVDREEHPDVDAVYMAATQAMTGQGGWPMTVFATPDGEPFLCGTYFPRANFDRLLDAVGEAWRDQREAVLRQGAAVVEAITPTALKGAQPITSELLGQAAQRLVAAHDVTYGGFGEGGPKFPPHLAMIFLLRHFQRTKDQEVLEVVQHTAEAMARGGLYDQVGGGFHRYAVDGHWVVPHFEKMLYDNALLLRAYADLWRLTGDELAGRVARETYECLVRDFATPEGGFRSAYDADTEGVEGLTYVWTPAQLVEVLGEEDGRFAADVFGVTAAGNFEHGTTVLTLARDIDAADPEVRDRWLRVKAKLFAARRDRPQPAIDGKVVAAWNALTITALGEYARVAEAMGEDPGEAAEQAERAATLLAELHLVDGKLRRVSLDGVVGEPVGVLEDYGCVAEAFSLVHQLTGEAVWLDRAGALIDTALTKFVQDGRVFDTASDSQRLVTRPADPTDNATPSGASALAGALSVYHALTGEPAFRERAEDILGQVADVIARHPRFAGYSAAAAEALLSGPVEIAIATPDRDQAADLVHTAVKNAPGGAVLVVGEPDRPGVPLLAGRPLIEGRPAAYVCRGFVCDRPVTDAVGLSTVLTA
ncbi:MAG: thioredoxin domain-containing protein [Hamadaea sp.]|uniref:thioredoxin domain-containing protein n=1 Tax=Hamadaea sp. TaxID=2024425 RepID=UPI0017A41F98|nr:thioredoxin domain-containing protein [Hamadaea sp.]NUR70628.1 thioredoxin domain-containing protein [Hamadaea sp.]NUT22366.1 thioredoxin domain-containing protein [Hamadaea sp.]